MKRGFTLIELSIVLVIIALIIGGVVTGRVLIENSLVAGQIAQLQRYDTAINTFRTKYNSLPSDSSKIPNVTYTGATPSYGNGDRIFGMSTGNNYPAYPELGAFFTALSSSGVITEGHSACNGTFNCDGTGVWSGLIGNNRLFPEIKMSPGNGIIMIGGINGGLYYFLGLNGPWIQGNQLWLHATSVSGVIPPAKAYVFDQKIDDGYPTTGNIFASTERMTTASTCQVFGCLGYTDPTVMQLAPNNNTCVNADDTYNADAQDVVANRCRLVVKSAAVAGD